MARRGEMAEQTTKKNGIGTINAIREVRVEAASTKFAMVTPDDGSSRLAIRIGPRGFGCQPGSDSRTYSIKM
jgi:hypothetical protein